MLLSKETKDRIEKEAAHEFPTGMWSTAYHKEIAKAHQFGYIAGAEAEAERAEQLYDCLLKIRNNIYTAGAVNKKIDEALTKYNNSK